MKIRILNNKNARWSLISFFQNNILQKKIILCITSLHIAYPDFIKIKIFLSDFDNIDNIWKLVW